VEFNKAVILHGYILHTLDKDSDRRLNVLTVWSVQTTTEDALKIFVHLLDDDGNIRAQQDYLGAPSWQWQPGDRFIHVHQIQHSDEMTDRAFIALGLYREKDGVRLSVTNQEHPIDHIVLKVEN
jgi:hypothetical protein